MQGIVLQLQEDALDKNSDVLSLLRKAHLVAKKLKLIDFEKWIDSELNGYSNNKVPAYRKVYGVLKGFNPVRGWIPVFLESSKHANVICNRFIYDSIPNLYNLLEANEGDITLTFSPEHNLIISKATHFKVEYRLFIGSNCIYEIIEKVKSMILDWAITLEESGIIGEELSFTFKEKETASSNQVIYNFTNNFYGNVSDTQVQQATNKSKQSNR